MLKSIIRVMSIMLILALLILIAGCKTTTEGTTSGETTEPDTTGVETTKVEETKELDQISLALSAFQDYNAIYVGVEKGFFEEEGIELVIQNADMPSSNELLLGGHIDLACSTMVSVILQNAVGQGTTLAFPFGWFCATAFMYDPEKHSDWKTFEQFMQENNNDTEEAIKLTLAQIIEDEAKIGLKLGGQMAAFLTIINYGGYTLDDFILIDMVEEDLPPALISGSIDIMIGGIPQRVAVSKEGYVALIEQTSVPETILHLGFGAQRQWVDDNFELAVRLQKVIFKTHAFIEQNPEEAFTIIADSLRRQGTDIEAQEIQGIWNVIEFFAPSKEFYIKECLTDTGKFYWKTAFESTITNLEQEEKIEEGSIENIEDLLYGIKIVNAIE